MAQTIQITCINKSERDNPYERITHVGGGQTLVTSWRKTQPQAIAEIENGDSQFFVSVGGESVWVIVAVSQHGNKYLKTQNDGEQPNNLLSLPECP